jgi:hypothetical protein
MKFGLRDHAPGDAVYIPFAQARADMRGQMVITVSLKENVNAVLPAIREQMRTTAKDLPMVGLTSEDEQIQSRTGEERSLAQLLGTFGLLAPSTRAHFGRLVWDGFFCSSAEDEKNRNPNCLRWAIGRSALVNVVAEPEVSSCGPDPGNALGNCCFTSTKKPFVSRSRIRSCHLHCHYCRSTRDSGAGGIHSRSPRQQNSSRNRLQIRIGTSGRVPWLSANLFPSQGQVQRMIDRQCGRKMSWALISAIRTVAPPSDRLSSLAVREHSKR